jgi:hypothetical protein
MPLLLSAEITVSARMLPRYFSYGFYGYRFAG